MGFKARRPGKAQGCPNEGKPVSRLRQRAEEEARRRQHDLSSADPSSLSREQIELLIHELRVHQIELEMQNEQLRATQSAAETARARYFDLYELAPVGYVTLRHDDAIVEANQQAGELLGAGRGKIVGTSFSAFVVADDQDDYYRFRRRLRDSVALQICEVRLRSQTRRPVWVRLVATHSRADQDAEAVIRVALSDISVVRTLQAELLQSDRMANMGVLAAGFAHEINNPLTYVLLNGEELARRLPQLAEVIDRLLDRIDNELIASLGKGHEMLFPGGLADVCLRAEQTVEGIRRIRDIARDLGRFSHKQATEPVRLDLNACIDSALAMAQNEIRYRARVIKDLGSIPSVLASESEMIQVFVNLLVNAAHAIAEGDAERSHIRVRTWADNSHVMAEVQDTGHGIAEHDRDLVFEPFFTTKSTDHGTGLGLSISRRIVANVGGTLELDNSVRDGARFVVTLPIARDSAAAAPTRPKNISDRARILLVDDDEMVRRSLCRVLEDQHEVISVGSAEQAMEVLGAGRRFDVVLCDLMMPEMDGVDLHAWVEKIYPKIAGRFVFITGGIFTPKVEAYLAASRTPCLKKPLSSDVLLQAVADQLVEE